MRSVVFFGLGSVMAASLAGAAVAQEPALPDGPGKEQIVTACTACHAITQVTSQRRSQASWADTVDQMISRGAQISDADYPIVVDYLTKHYGTAPAGAAPAAKP